MYKIIIIVWILVARIFYLLEMISAFGSKWWSTKAEDLMEQLRPIFDALRQREELPCSYPLHVGSTHGTKQAFIYQHSRGPQGSHQHHFHQPHQPHPPHQGQQSFWVRERSARSVPMGTTRASRSSLSAGTPDSLSDNEASLGQTPRSALKKPSLARSNLTPGGSGPPSRTPSRPASRTGSKPPSRHGSNLSLDSTDDGTPSRIPLSRRLPATTSTVRSGLSTPRTTASKQSAPNGSARPRTPTGLVSPAPGRYTGSGMYRTSSIPTLSATGSMARSSSFHRTGDSGTPVSSRGPGSKIPVFTKEITNTTNTNHVRARTPSGSSTPVVPGQTTAASRLLRKGSNASESSTAAATATSANGRKTPVRSSATPDRREPFRL